MKIYIPWKIRKLAYLIYQESKILSSRIRLRKHRLPGVSFLCRYHQPTGATVAIACIANQLADRYDVDAFVSHGSGYSKLLSVGVRQHFSDSVPGGAIVFVDIEQETEVLERLLKHQKIVLTSCHALPTVLHGVPQEKLIRNLALSSWIHFVSEYQRSEFIRHYPDIPISGKSFVIPNYTRQSTKNSTTGNVGMIGYLNRKPKNAIEGIRLAHQSNARLIQCWGSSDILGIDRTSDFPKLRINGWTNSLSRMHESFDVLVSTSRFETFGLVVTEALSAGIPCFLSDIPVFRELFTGCPGVVFQSGDDARDIASINLLLDQASRLKAEIQRFYTERFSNTAVRNAWNERIDLIASAAHPLDRTTRGDKRFA